jgi:hypothetical protein
MASNNPVTSGRPLGAAGLYGGQRWRRRRAQPTAGGSQQAAAADHGTQGRTLSCPSVSVETFGAPVLPWGSIHHATGAEKQARRSVWRGEIAEQAPIPVSPHTLHIIMALLRRGLSGLLPLLRQSEAAICSSALEGLGVPPRRHEDESSSTSSTSSWRGPFRGAWVGCQGSPGSRDPRAPTSPSPRPPCRLRQRGCRGQAAGPVAVRQTVDDAHQQNPVSARARACAVAAAAERPAWRRAGLRRCSREQWQCS